MHESPTWWASTFLLGLLPGIWVKGYLQGSGMTMLNPTPSLGDGSKQCSPGALRTAHRQFQSLRTPSMSKQSDSLPQQLLPLFRQLGRIFLFSQTFCFHPEPHKPPFPILSGILREMPYNSSHGLFLKVWEEMNRLSRALEKQSSQQ